MDDRAELDDDVILAAMRDACGALDRLCGEMITVWVDPVGRIHEKDGCADGATAQQTTALALSSEFVCRHCESVLTDRGAMVDYIAGDLVDLYRGPHHGWGAGAVGRVGRVTANAAMVRGTVEELDVLLKTVDAADAAELRTYADELLRVWTAWLHDQGAAELVTMTRLAGAGAVATRDEFHLDVELADLPTVSSTIELVDLAFTIFVEAHLNGVDDPRAAVVERLLHTPELFTMEVENLGVGELTELVAECVDLYEVLDRIRDRARRRDIATVLDLLETRILPAGDPDDWKLVITRHSDLDSMFWSQALQECFPSASCHELAVLCLPTVIADCVVATVHKPQSFMSGQVLARPLADPTEATAVVATVAALLSGGLDPYDAAVTADAVMA